MTQLAIVNLTYIHDGQILSLEKFFKVFLYFERLIEQSVHNRASYNFGTVPQDQRERSKFIKLQKTHLMPMLRHQMARNEAPEAQGQRKMDAAKLYLFNLFEHFCDAKREYIDLTCIKDKRELDNMHPALKSILFEGMDNTLSVRNIKLIFPNLKQLCDCIVYRPSPRTTQPCSVQI